MPASVLRDLKHNEFVRKRLHINNVAEFLEEFQRTAEGEK
jgi:hypothetical protein